MQSLVTLYEAGLVNYTDPSVTSPDGHVSSENGPGVGLGVVHLHTGQVTGSVISADHVEGAVMSDDLGLRIL